MKNSDLYPAGFDEDDLLPENQPMNLTTEEIEKKIREICTYHSEDDIGGDGTSGYDLSEEQFEKIFELFTSALQRIQSAERKRVLEIIGGNEVPKKYFYKKEKRMYPCDSKVRYRNQYRAELREKLVTEHHCTGDNRPFCQEHKVKDWCFEKGGGS